MSTLMRLNPFREITSLQERMNRLFGDTFSGIYKEPSETIPGWFSPATDVSEDENRFYMSFELPGVTEKDVKVTIENGVLTVTGERKEEAKTEKESWLRRECVYGSFSRSFTLPTTVNPDTAEAKYNNGVLELTFAKRAEAKPKHIPISTSSGVKAA